jgi:hypothetical protein
LAPAGTEVFSGVEEWSRASDATATHFGPKSEQTSIQNCERFARVCETTGANAASRNAAIAIQQKRRRERRRISTQAV